MLRLERGLRRAGESVLNGSKKFVVPVLAVIAIFATSLSAQDIGGVSGTVRDLRGKPQMGVLVELMDSAATSTALTDLEGHYQFKNVLPGIYQLRATAVLYLPSLRRQLRIQPRIRTVANLTMSKLFDEASWASSGRLDGSRDDDDWKWTLRSPANRPLLRLVGKETSSTPSGLEQGQSRAETHGVLTAESSKGRFGSFGDGVSLRVQRRSINDRRVVLFHAATAKAEGGTSAPPLFLSTLLQSDPAGARANRMFIRLRTFPQIRNIQGDPMTVVDVGSAERFQIGDSAALEIGSETQLIKVGNAALISHPFLRFTSGSLAGWTFAFGFATSSAVSHLTDLGGEKCIPPTALVARRGLVTEADSHQEIVARRTFKKAEVQLLYQHDVVKRTALSGELLGVQNAKGTLGSFSVASGDVALDRNSGAFQLFAPGSLTNGFGFRMDLPINDSLALSADYLSGAGVSLQPASRGVSGNDFHISQASTVLASINGKVPRVGTWISVAYRWQADKDLNRVSPYQSSETEPFLSFHLRQSLPTMTAIPAGIEITIDGDNLTGEGYQTYHIAQQDAFLASALRDLRAGLSYSF